MYLCFAEYHTAGKLILFSNDSQGDSNGNIPVIRCVSCADKIVIPINSIFDLWELPLLNEKQMVTGIFRNVL